MNLVALTGLLEWLRLGAAARHASAASEPGPRPSPGESEAGERLPPCSLSGTWTQSHGPWSSSSTCSASAATGTCSPPCTGISPAGPAISDSPPACCGRCMRTASWSAWPTARSSVGGTRPGSRALVGTKGPASAHVRHPRAHRAGVRRLHLQHDREDGTHRADPSRDPPGPRVARLVKGDSPLFDQRDQRHRIRIERSVAGPSKPAEGFRVTIMPAVPPPAARTS